ncbi:MAG: DNA cytosine methyltransferase [Bacteroidales bacterium]|nr:DNA cytosine methyltransferase [Bacteroidales bacterium]
MIVKKQPKAISLFAGAGGCSLGFKQAGYNIVYATDFDKSAIETYKKNFPDTLAECKDIKDIDFSQLLVDLELKQGEIDILIGGPPCQGFSTAGPRFWDDPRNHLLKQYIRALEIIQPKWFLMENVEGLLTSNDGEYIRETVKAFVKLGYSIRLEKVYSQEYAVPQRRKRVIIIGNRLGIDFSFPHPTTHSHGKIFRKSSITIEHALFGLPKPTIENKELKYDVDFSNSWAKTLKSKSEIVTDHFIQNIDETQLERISMLKQGQTMKDLPEYLQHPSFKKRAARRVMDGTPSEKRGGAPSGLKRLKFDEPSLTITGAAIREFIHPIEDRCLTIRECARIQTFPDDFIFIGSNGDKIQQIGNAIPPLLAKTFAEHIYNIGFNDNLFESKGVLLDFVLTKSEGLSPALQKTERLLSDLKPKQVPQLTLFENAY